MQKSSSTPAAGNSKSHTPASTYYANTPSRSMREETRKSLFPSSISHLNHHNLEFIQFRYHFLYFARTFKKELEY